MPKTKAKLDPDDFGFVFKEDGRIKFINYNRLARGILKHFTLVYHPSGFFYIYRNGVYKKLDNNQIARKLCIFVNSIVKDCWNPTIENNYISALRLSAKRVDNFNQDHNYINFRNGLLDMRTFKLESHTPEFYSTIQIPIKYIKKASCPVFDKFILEVCSRDKDMVNLIGEMMGYCCLTAETRAHKAFILSGEGSNGKSTLLDVIREIAGDENVSAVPLKDIESPFRRTALVGKAVNILTENEFGRTGFQTQHFKAIVSGDIVTAEIKGGETFSFRPSCKMIFAMNRLPNTEDKTFGFRRRLIIIPFDEMFTGDKADKLLDKKLSKELSGILLFALTGLKRLRKNNYDFTIPKRSQTALKHYFDNVDPIGAFVRDSLTQSTKSRIKNSILHRKFQEWQYTEGYSMNITQREFIEHIKSALRCSGINFDTGKSGGERYISGIAFRGNNGGKEEE